MVVILKDFDFGPIASEGDLPWRLDGSGRGRAFRSSNWDSPRFKDHKELLLMEFLGPDFMNWDGSSPLPKLGRNAIRKLAIRKLIISYGSRRAVEYTRELGRDHCNHLLLRHEKYGALTVLPCAHFAALPANTPPFLVTHFIKLICGATNYDGGRRRKFAPEGSVHPERSPSNPFPCYLCGQGDVDRPGDNENHILCSWRVVKDAWMSILRHPKGPHDDEWVQHFADKVSPLFIIDFPLGGKDCGFCRLALVLSFCWAIYRTIGQVRMGRCVEGAGERAVSLTLSLTNVWSTVKPRAKLKKPG